ncbi:protein downstream neighbor of Son-like isoform X2 [Oppia nitens]|uniref:protein downstream neighbor of Son-like isoform X2 n=1 Tax=Oppia nitens TaxID=1686743 RepID=UPI0023DBC1DF|nr:protein downstream neighbor of Son-like isoform X2 [Oppia nitens]
MMDTPTKRKLSPISPQFMKPSDLFRKRKERKTSKVSPSKISPSKTLYSPLKCLQNYDNCSNIVSPQKTFSPFRQKRTPKRNQIRNSFPIVKKLSSTPPKGKRKLNFQTISDKNVLNFDENANIESANCSANFPLNRDSKQDLIDWTLKTRLRFVSDKAFAFRGSFRATEESAGISGFVRCLTSKANIDTDSLSNQSNQDSMDTSFASQLHKQCLIWSHPSLPWLTLFPRNESHMKPGAPLSSKAPTFSIIPNTPLADALHTDWCKSLKSLYQLLKAKHCPYFYVCANTFTILFRASGVADSDDIHVFVTPTSTGFRKLLTDEGINFSLPFCDNKNTTNSEDNTTSGYHSINIPPILSSNDQKNIADNCDVGDDNEESPHVWLESLGLSQQDFPSLQSKRKNRTDNAVSKVKSLVLIKGMANTQLFLNFLLNARICVANSGPLSGIPPTLLSPTAFHGSTLQSLKVKQTVSEIGDNQSYNCLEVSGPILPNCMNGLINLMKETHDSFKASFATYEPTQAFSSVMVSKEPNVTSRAFAIENLKDCGLDKQFLSNVCSDDCRASEPINKLIVKNSIVLYNQNF